MPLCLLVVKVLHNQMVVRHVLCEVASTASPLFFLLHSVLHLVDSVCCVHPAATVMALDPQRVLRSGQLTMSQTNQSLSSLIHYNHT